MSESGITRQEVAKRLGRSFIVVRNLIADGKLKATKGADGIWRVDPADVAPLLASRGQPSQKIKTVTAEMERDAEKRAQRDHEKHMRELDESTTKKIAERAAKAVVEQEHKRKVAALRSVYESTTLDEYEAGRRLGMTGSRFRALACPTPVPAELVDEVCARYGHDEVERLGKEVAVAGAAVAASAGISSPTVSMIERLGHHAIDVLLKEVKTP